MPRSIRQTLRPLRVTTLALALLVPPLAHAQGTVPMTSLIGSPSLGPAVGQMGYGGLVGLELAPEGFSVGPRFSFEAMYGFMDLMPQLRLDLGGRVSLAYHSGDFDTSLWNFDIVPDARLRYSVTEQLGVYGDVGLGLAIMHVSAPTVVVNGVTYGGTTDPALTFQLGFGAAYAITPNINLLGEIRFDFYTKSGAGTFISLPAVGLEFH